MNYIFIAFYGWEDHKIKLAKYKKIGDKFEIWNLQKFKLEEFVENIKNKIPPVNQNVINNYLSEEKLENDYGIKEETFKKTLWGILCPVKDKYYFDHSEFVKITFLLDLYLNNNLYPAFFVSHMGITKINKFKMIEVLPNDLQKYKLINKNFITFYKEFIDTTKYIIWNRDEILKWNEEDWRLYIATNFYNDLKKYKSKNIFNWQKESADMCILLETLLTAGDSSTEEIGYRLRKRVSVLMNWIFVDIEEEIKKLYKERSNFIHGSHYKNIIKEMRKNPYDKALPVGPNFKELEKIKDYIRHIFIFYLYLNKEKDNNIILNKYLSVKDILEDSILNTTIRKEIIKIIKKISKILPKE